MILMQSLCTVLFCVSLPSPRKLHLLVLLTVYRYGAKATQRKPTNRRFEKKIHVYNKIQLPKFMFMAWHMLILLIQCVFSAISEVLSRSLHPQLHSYVFKTGSDTFPIGRKGIRGGNLHVLS